MANSARDPFIIQRSKRRLLSRAVLRQRAGEQRHRGVTTLAMTRELNSSSPQKNIDAFAVKGFARSVTMQRFRPGCVRIVMTACTSLGAQELFHRNCLTAFGARV